MSAHPGFAAGEAVGGSVASSGGELDLASLSDDERFVGAEAGLTVSGVISSNGEDAPAASWCQEPGVMLSGSVQGKAPWAFDTAASWDVPRFFLVIWILPRKAQSA